ncbi:MAG: hypothetical protein Q9160_000533 [Pyrenula sp. 1 TL-2023]
MDDTFPDTRLFVSGLPPNFTDEELGKHFAGRYQITDAQVISGRRIGFVGFRNYTLAKNAIQYFDKSYIRMSKIHVEFAKPPGQTEIDRDSTHQREPSRKEVARSPVAAASKSREAGKLVEVNTTNLSQGKDATGFKHFKPILTSTHSRKRKINHVDTETKGTDQGISTTGNGHTEAAEKPHSETKSKKKKSKQSLENTDQAGSNEEANHKATKKQKKKRREDNDERSQRQRGETGGDSPSQNTVQVEERDSDSDHLAQQTTDDDWLRAKTSRVLGLVEEDGMVESESVTSSKTDTADTHSEDAVDFASANQVPLSHTSSNGAHMSVSSNGRLFLRNLSFGSTETEIEDAFSTFGTIEEVHLVRDSHVGSSRGLAYVQFRDADSATRAIEKMDGRAFGGRLLHVLPASEKRSYPIDEYSISKLPLKKQKLVKRKLETSGDQFSWNSLYMNPDAVVASVAERLGVTKSDIIDPSSTDAAVKQAHAETHIIQETKAFFRNSGVNLDALRNKDRSGTALLVKNLAHGTTEDEIRSLFEPVGQIKRLLFPPSGVLAILEFASPADTRQALSRLAYRNHRGSVLYLERAPSNCFESNDERKTEADPLQLASHGASEGNPPSGAVQSGSTLFIRNLNFATTSTELTDLCRHLEGFLAAKVKTKVNPKNPSQILSMGYGFAEFRNAQHAQSALKALNGSNLDGHQLLVRFAQRSRYIGDKNQLKSQDQNTKHFKTKVVIKNLPFETTKKDVRALLGPYGQLRSVRVPKKFDRSTRGFAFADFISGKEAANAIGALKDTHLLGRRLVLQFAANDAVDPEREIQAIEERVSKQTDTMNSKMVKGLGRKKFNVDAQDVE